MNEILHKIRKDGEFSDSWASLLQFACVRGPDQILRYFVDNSRILPQLSLCWIITGASCPHNIYKLHASKRFCFTNWLYEAIYNSDESGNFKGGLYNTQTSPGVVTIHTASVRLSAESQPLSQRFSEFCSHSSAELSHALPCTGRREQLSPRLASLTSNPQLLHSLHGPRHVIDHNTSEKGLNQTVSQTCSTRFPTCEMGGTIRARLAMRGEDWEYRGRLETGAAICLMSLWSAPPSLAHDTLTWDTAYTARDLHL